MAQHQIPYHKPTHNNTMLLSAHRLAPSSVMLLHAAPARCCGTTSHRLGWRASAAAAAGAAGQQQQPVTTAAAGTSNTAEQQRVKQEQLQQQWFQQSDVYYSNYPLNRAAEQRRDEAQLEAWFNAPNTRVTPVMGSRVLLLPSNSSSSSSSSSGAKYHPVWVSPAAELGAALNPFVPPIFLGLDASGAPHFAVQVTRESSEQLATSHQASWLAARAAGPDMSRGDAALLAVASGLAQWNLDTQYHGTTGAQTLPRVSMLWRCLVTSGYFHRWAVLSTCYVYRHSCDDNTRCLSLSCMQDLLGCQSQLGGRNYLYLYTCLASV
jgi:hypothetical protein